MWAIQLEKWRVPPITEALINRKITVLITSAGSGDVGPMGLWALKISLDYAIVLVVKHTELGPCQSTASHDNPHRI